MPPTPQPPRRSRLVKTPGLRPGMTISRPDETISSASTLPAINKISPTCQNGIHFGSGCYDRLATWTVWER